MPRLRTVSPRSAGLARHRHGTGFRYRDHRGGPAPREDVERIEALVIPPAWEDVWICRWPSGHIQAVGTDEAGRRQYLYHPQWRVQRDRVKHDRVLDVARRLPGARALVAADLDRGGVSRERVLACAFRLLDLGFFRVGGETYAETNATFGLATLRCRHVRVEGDEVVFDYVAKSHKDRTLVLRDEAVRAVVSALLGRGAGPETDLLAWQDDEGAWHDVQSSEINAYVKEVVSAARPQDEAGVEVADGAPGAERADGGGGGGGGDVAPEAVEVSAKDFRTWHATVLAALALAVSTHAATTEAARKRAVSRAMQEVSAYLGNTPTVARASYVDPRVVDLFEDGTTIEPILEELGVGAAFGEPATHGAVEAAVLHLLTHPGDARRRARRSRADAEKAVRRAARAAAAAA